MYTVSSNASRLSAIYKSRTSKLTAGLIQLFRSSLIKINRLALENLSGSNSAEPGSYPVPNRTGNLFRGQNWSIASNNVGFVFNTARYAFDVHEGQGSSKLFGRRAFLDDAVDQSNLLDDHQKKIRDALFT